MVTKFIPPLADITPHVWPSENLRHSNDPKKTTTSGAAVLLKEIKILDLGGAREAGLRIKVDGKSGGSDVWIGVQIRRNGKLLAEQRIYSGDFVTVVFDIDNWKVNDLIQLWGYHRYGGWTTYVKNFRLYFDFYKAIFKIGGVELKRSEYLRTNLPLPPAPSFENTLV